MTFTRLAVVVLLLGVALSALACGAKDSNVDADVSGRVPERWEVLADTCGANAED